MKKYIQTKDKNIMKLFANKSLNSTLTLQLLGAFSLGYLVKSIHARLEMHRMALTFKSLVDSIFALKLFKNSTVEGGGYELENELENMWKDVNKKMSVM